MRKFLLIFIASLSIWATLADNSGSSDSGSGSDSDSHSKEKHHKLKHHHTYHGHDNNPVYVPPPQPLNPYYLPGQLTPAMYYPPPPQGYYPHQPQYPQYPYGGYYPPPPMPYQPNFYASVPFQPFDQQPRSGYPQTAPNAIPTGKSSINHSLKVNKEYKEDGHRYRTDSTE